VFQIQCVMVGFVVPVLANNPLAYSLVLVSLHETCFDEAARVGKTVVRA